MKRTATLLVVLAMMGCAGESKEAIFPPDTSADAAACREEATRDPKLQEMRHSIYLGFQAQDERVSNQIIETQRRSYFDCMSQRGHVRRGGVERVRR